jgi:hypothetical protein
MFVLTSLLIVLSLLTAGAVAQEKAPMPRAEKEKAGKEGKQAPVAVPSQEKIEEPKSLGVPIAAPESVVSSGTLKVDEARLGNNVQEGGLAGEATEFAPNGRVYLWMKLSGGPAEDITVTWKHGGKGYGTKLKVGGSPWRTWAYKTVAVPGDWSVTVTDAAGNVLKELKFQVVEKMK